MMILWDTAADDRMAVTVQFGQDFVTLVDAPDGTTREHSRTSIAFEALVNQRAAVAVLNFRGCYDAAAADQAAADVRGRPSRRRYQPARCDDDTLAVAR